VTKNHFDPALRIGHQPASQYSNYNGSLMFHLAEAFHMRRSAIAEQPTPSEIGGYALGLDDQFASVFANAGGMQIQANMRGQVAVTHANRWSPLGIVRFARAGWDTRLGPSDGAMLVDGGGVTFAPTFRGEDRRWVRLADVPERYEAHWSVSLVHPLLVRCTIRYAPKQGQSGPTFRNDLTLTPDGVVSVTAKTSPQDAPWGITWPLLENDGRPLRNEVGSHIATVAYPGGSDEQNFIALHQHPELMREETALRSTYGDLRPVRVIVPDAENRTFVYPRSAGDPAGEAVRTSFSTGQNGFQSVLGRVEGDVYIGRTSAGGIGRGIDLDADGKRDVEFDRSCGFLLQIRNGKVTAAETDSAVSGTIQGRRVTFQAHTPWRSDAQ
jgi:hypothetical protein